MTEQQIQSKRIKELESQGYYVIKLINTNKNGIPDLIAIPPNAEILNQGQGLSPMDLVLRMDLALSKTNVL